MALGWLPTRRLGGDGGTVAMLAALLADLVASLAGTLPVWRARHRPPIAAVPAQLGAMALRLVVVLILGLALALSGLVPVPAFLVWLALGHAGLLVADTLFARSMTAIAQSRHPAAKPAPTAT